MTHDLPDACIESPCLWSALSSEMVLHAGCAICVQSFFKLETGVGKDETSHIVCQCDAGKYADDSVKSQKWSWPSQPVGTLTDSVLVFCLAEYPLSSWVWATETLAECTPSFGMHVCTCVCASLHVCIYCIAS